MPEFEIDKWENTLRAFRRAAKVLTSGLEETLRPLFPLFGQMAQLGLALKLEADYEEFCKKHNWVPHRLVQGYFDYPSDNNQFEQVRIHWPELRRKLLHGYADFGGGSRREIFNQILKAFSAGAPVIVVRSAVTEIEGLSADFCKLHSENTQNKIKNFVTNAPEHMGKLMPSDIGGLLPYKVMLDYSDQIFKSTEAHLHTDTIQANLNVNRHANAHATHTEATEFDALNAILLLHQYATYFHALDRQFKRTH